MTAGKKPRWKVYEQVAQVHVNQQKLSVDLQEDLEHQTEPPHQVGSSGYKGHQVQSEGVTFATGLDKATTGFKLGNQEVIGLEITLAE